MGGDRIFRRQKIFALRRCVVEDDGSETLKYYVGKGAWNENIARAFVCPKPQALRLAQIDLGVQCDLVEVIPSLSPVNE